MLLVGRKCAIFAAPCRRKLFLQRCDLVKIPTDGSLRLPFVDVEDLIHDRAEVIRKPALVRTRRGMWLGHWSEPLSPASVRKFTLGESRASIRC